MSALITPVQEWWTAEEIAAASLPDLPASRQGVEAVIKRVQWRETGPSLARRREGKGGGWEYNWQLFPDRAKRQLLQAAAVQAATPKTPARASREEAWVWFEGLPQSVKSKAAERLKIIQQVEALEAVQGRGRHMAAVDVAKISNTGTRTIWTWFQMIEGVRVDVVDSLSEASYTIPNKSFEKTIGVNRDNIEDDNLGMYSDGFTMMGDGAAETETPV